MKVLSLFSNVGIGETYLNKIGMEVVIANELEEDRVEFYRSMHPKTNMIQGSITDSEVYKEILQDASKHNIELIIATPPCQGMSIANARKTNKDDPRNSLIKKVVSLTLELNPKYVLIENVRGMASDKTFILDDDGNKINIMPFLVDKLGNDYEIRYKVLDAADYGTPHYRKRLITLLSRKDCELWEHPEPNKNHITVRQIIGGYPSLESGEDYRNRLITLLSRKDCELWEFKTTYKRIDWDKPAPTVTMANGSINSQNNCHPGIEKENGTYSDARVLTIKELLAIVGLPLDWVDHLEHTQKREIFLRKVIGECFPPIMALNIIEKIPKKTLDKAIK